MTVRNLNFFFQPKRVALVGASERPGSIGLHVAENLLRAGFRGEIGFVNPRRTSVLGKPCYASIRELALRAGAGRGGHAPTCGTGRDRGAWPKRAAAPPWS